MFAYNASVKSIKTVANWLKEIAAEDEYNINQLKETNPADRSFFDNLFLDGVFVLGKGFVALDVLPFQSVINTLKEGATKEHIWFWADEHELQMLWILVNTLADKLMWNDASLHQYLPEKNVTISD